MKNLNYKSQHKSLNWLFFSGFGLILSILLIRGVFSFLNWHDNNVVKTQELKIDLILPKMWVEKRPLASPIVEYIMNFPIEADTPIKQYVCEKFGQDCNIALAVIQCESGWDEDALGANPDVPWSYRADVGLMQINSIHWDKFGGIVELLDPYKNIDAGYEIYLDSGWTAWVTVNNGCVWKEIK